MIRILILFGLALILFYIGSHKRVTSLQFAFLTIFFLCGALLVLKPEEANSIAEAVGVGRGADLLLYFSVLAGIYVSAAFYIRFRYNEQALIAIVRKVAISLPEHEEEITRSGDSPGAASDHS